MRWIGWSLVLAATAGGLAYAQPRLAPPTPPAKRKPALVTYQPMQLQLFAKAVIADKRGDLDDAEDEYKSVLRLGPALTATWNLADVSRRRERWSDAIKTLKDYIELAETDADKQAAEALIKEIEATPYRVGISGDEPGGIIFVDGVKFPSPAPVTLELDPGRHRIDWIGTTGYQDQTLTARPMGTDVARMHLRDDAKGGNVILALSGEMPTPGEWTHKGTTFKLDARLTVPPGRYDLPVYDNRTCSNIVFDAPRDGFVFVFIKVERRSGSDCYPITVTSTKVKP